ncbi:hypothetical protein KKG24_00325 [Patescibacteria group bacterium]|nr:hypothetical protein [Patescibacteria group bacterium]
MKNRLTDNKEKPYTSAATEIDFGISRINDISAIGETLHSKIDPLIGVQTALMDSATKLAQIYEPVKESMGKIGALISPVAETVQLLGTNLAEVSKTAIATGELLNAPTYDFLKSPMASILNVSTDAIQIGQERIMSIMPDSKGTTTLLEIGVSGQISQISALNSIALDSLQSSPILFPVSKTDEKISDLDNKIQLLESKIIHLEKNNDNLFLTDITSNIVKILEDLDDEIADCFKGAIRTMLDNKNKDLVGQVSESLTRVVEKLPLVLVKVNSRVRKEEKIKLAMLEYLDKLPDQYEKESLIIQQKSFYSVFGILRHRNAKQYKMFKNDISRFKSLVIIFESFIYTLITINDNEK